MIAGKSFLQQASALPPNCDSLLKQIERANLQASTWNRYLSPQLYLPTAVENEWRLSDGQLEVVWTTRPRQRLLMNSANASNANARHAV